MKISSFNFSVKNILHYLNIKIQQPKFRCLFLSVTSLFIFGCTTLPTRPAADSVYLFKSAKLDKTFEESIFFYASNDESVSLKDFIKTQLKGVIDKENLSDGRSKSFKVEIPNTQAKEWIYLEEYFDKNQSSLLGETLIAYLDKRFLCLDWKEFEISLGTPLMEVLVQPETWRYAERDVYNFYKNIRLEVLGSCVISVAISKNLIDTNK